MAIPKFLSLFFLALLLSLSISNVVDATKLKLGFYSGSCPGVEIIVAQKVYQIISRVPTLAAPLLRMHFHDCFVRGCDGSVLLNSTSSNVAEKDAIPNLSLRGFQIIDIVKTEVEKKCPGVVSCADILALVARDAVRALNGPFWEVPTGRKDGRVSISFEALTNLPSPFSNITVLKARFLSKGLNTKDLVVLSGGHTIGTSHCNSFSNRLYNFTGVGDSDPNLDRFYAAALRKKCKPIDQRTLVEMDPGSFKTFDVDYYKLVAKRRGLFQSDSALLDDSETKGYIQTQVNTQGSSSFADDFAASMVKMGSIGVLTGSSGEIRKKCSVVN